MLTAATTHDYVVLQNRDNAGVVSPGGSRLSFARDTERDLALRLAPRMIAVICGCGTTTNKYGVARGTPAR